MHSDEHEYMGGSGCSRCGSLSLSGQWLQSFGVAICNSCRQDEELVTKARARRHPAARGRQLRPAWPTVWLLHPGTSSG